MRIKKLLNSSPWILLFSGILIWMLTATQVDAADPEVRSFQLMSPGQAHITVDAPVDQTFQFLVSTNLPDWKPAGPLPPVTFDGATATYLLEIDPEKPLATYQVEYQPVPPNPVPLAALDGPANEMVSQHLPDMGLPLELDGEIEVIQGVHPFSTAHVLVTFKSSTTIQALNDLLAVEDMSLAGAVPVINLGVLRRNQVTTLADLNDQAGRLSASGLFDAVALNGGLSRPQVFEDPSPQLNSVGSQVPHLDWVWDLEGPGKGKGGNNAFEMSRIPQLWNWLDYGHRQKAAGAGHIVASFDVAFTPHQELTPPGVVMGFVPNSTLAQDDANHGTAVIGIIAARHDTVGTQGVTPLANQVLGIPWPQASPTWQWQQFADISLGQLASLLIRQPAPKVINVSMGIPYYSIGNPTNVTIVPGKTYASWMDDMGDLWTGCFRFLHYFTSTTNYLVVCSAGNDSGVDARYNSPMANIACRPELNANLPQFITVENVKEDRTTSAKSNYDKSGIGHSVSAGGTDITVLRGPLQSGYKTLSSGTSYSSPFVTGLASFLWTLDPSLSVTEMKSLLLSSDTTFDVQSGTRGKLVDGFAAALGIDILRTNLNLWRALVDVDDGTHDGNFRAALLGFEKNPNKIHTGDGRRGDGAVNMKDFRAFRDAWLQVIGVTSHLDGRATHFKRDLNFDGLVVNQPVSPPHPPPYTIGSRTDLGLSELTYSRYDFNGNGRLDTNAQSAFPELEAIAPFRADPDSVITGRSVAKGHLRDIDVLLSKYVWEQDEENVVVTNSYPSPGIYDAPPHDWTTNALGTLFVTYLHSFDFHVDMEAGDPNSWDERYFDYSDLVIHDGLFLDSYFHLRKARSGAWQGVVTMPFDFIGEFPTMSVYYKKTMGDEFHQYVIFFKPELGEDVGLAVGFDKLEFKSNTRDFAGYYLEESNDPEFHEIIAKTPGSGTYGDFFVPFAEYDRDEVRNQARILAHEALGSRLKFPAVFNGSPGFEPIYEEVSEDDGTRVEIYGIKAIFNSIIGTQITP